MPICEMCLHSYGACGRLCIHDPLKRNALLFHGDGRVKTLKERRLSWDDPPVRTSVAPLRKNPPELSLLKVIEGVTKKRHGVTKNRPSVTDITETPVPGPTPVPKPDAKPVPAPAAKMKRSRGRPAKADALSAAEKQRQYRERKRKDKIGLPPRRPLA